MTRNEVVVIVDFITSVSILNLRLQNCNFNRNTHIFHITDPFLRITDEILILAISHVLNEQGTGYEHIFFSVQTFNID